MCPLPTVLYQLFMCTLLVCIVDVLPHEPVVNVLLLHPGKMIFVFDAVNNSTLRRRSPRFCDSLISH